MKKTKNTLVVKMKLSKDSIDWDEQCDVSIIFNIIKETVKTELEKKKKRIRKVKNPVEIIVKVKTANK